MIKKFTGYALGMSLAAILLSFRVTTGMQAL
jgi:hypothetical protein